MKILQNSLVLLLLVASFFIVSAVPAYSQTQTSYIIVHCHNPEGKEINSIEGMCGNEVEIYDGDTFIGYGAYNTATHNQPFYLSEGEHTIKAKFNGIELSQIINLSQEEVRVLTFTFPRTEFNHKEFLNSIGSVSASRTYISGGYGIDCVDFYIDTRFPEIFPCFGAAVTLYTRNAIVNSYTYISFNINGGGISINIGANNSVEYLPVEPPNDNYYAMNIGAYEGHWNGLPQFYLVTVPPLSSAIFRNWYIQKNGGDVSGKCHFVLWRGAGPVVDLVNSIGYSLLVMPEEANAVGALYAECYFYDYNGEIGQVLGSGVFTNDKVWVASVPYDLTGTAVGDEKKLLIVEAKTDKSSYTIGEQAKVSCKVTDDSGIVVSGVLVTAEITKPDSEVETVLLSEKQQEQGTYEGVFTNISLQGTYNATIKAQKEGYPDATPVNLTFTAERNKIPLGKSLAITNPDIEFYSIYIPDRYGGDLTVTAAGGGAIGLYYPDPYTKVANAATRINYPVTFNQHGWYYVKVINTISNISNTFVQTGKASYRPWNFWYWPVVDWKNPNLYDDGGALAKYDALFGTQARNYEEYWWGGYVNRRTGRAWDLGEGHCWGASIASILLPQPRDTVYHKFSNDEMEGLVSELADTNVICEKIVSDVPPIKPRPGKDEVDKFISKIHVGLVLHLLLNENQDNRPLQGNLRDINGNNPNAIWNHAIYRYASDMKESEEDKEDIIEICTTLYSNHDIIPPPTDNTTDRIDTYVYKLRFTAEGEILRDFSDRDWISASGFAPQNLWYIKNSSFNNTDNPYVTKENVEELGVDFP